MSYDLYFTTPKISREQFKSHFAGNRLYEVSPGQAIYENKDTGVYFVFTFGDSAPADPGEIASSASFNLNYYRPHYFGLEAVKEVTMFVERFGFSVHDPQMNGMGDGPYSSDAFLKGWNHGNAFGYSAMVRGKNGPGRVWSLPTARLDPQGDS